MAVVNVSCCGVSRQAYGQAKLCNLLFAYELDRRCRLGGVPIASNAIHPGGLAVKESVVRGMIT